jgi:hypothetical protein
MELHLQEMAQQKRPDSGQEEQVSPMSHAKSKTADSAAAENFVSEWFLKNYPNMSLDDLADRYRELRTEVPLIAIQGDAYGSFYGRMTGNPTLENVQAAHIPRIFEPQSAWTSLMPVVALFSLVALCAASALIFMSQ